MSEPQDLDDEKYDPGLVMARVAHLPSQAQREVEQISRIVRAAFGYGGPDLPEAGQIIRIVLTAPTEAPGVDAIADYEVHVVVNLPECADEAHWHFARRLIAGEIDARRPVTLRVTTGDRPAGITLYDATTDVPLNTRELPLPR